MWFLVLVSMVGTVPEVHPLAFFYDYDECMVVLHEVEFGIQGTDEALLCLEAKS